MPHTCNNCKSHVRIIYRCRVCDDFDLCVSCKRKDGHPHPMEFGSNLQTTQRCVQLVIHVSQCRDTNCRLASCQKMKQVMHTKKWRPISPVAGVVFFRCCLRCVVVRRNACSILVHHQDCSIQRIAATIITGATAQQGFTMEKLNEGRVVLVDGTGQQIVIQPPQNAQNNVPSPDGQTYINHQPVQLEGQVQQAQPTGTSQTAVATNPVEPLGSSTSSPVSQNVVMLEIQDGAKSEEAGSAGSADTTNTEDSMRYRPSTSSGRLSAVDELFQRLFLEQEKYTDDEFTRFIDLCEMINVNEPNTEFIESSENEGPETVDEIIDDDIANEPSPSSKR